MGESKPHVRRLLGGKGILGIGGEGTCGEGVAAIWRMTKPVSTTNFAHLQIVSGWFRINHFKKRFILSPHLLTGPCFPYVTLCHFLAYSVDHVPIWTVGTFGAVGFSTFFRDCSFSARAPAFGACNAVWMFFWIHVLSLLHNNKYGRI